MHRLILPDEVRDRGDFTDDALIAAGVITRRANGFVDVRARPLELRTATDGTRSLVGYATTWDTEYDVAGGPPYGWVESIAKGAATKSLAERDDVRFLVNHEGLPLARTKSGTMTLSADDIGLLVEVNGLDTANPVAAELLSALDRGDVDQMSFAFQVLRQEWSGDYEHRRILELRLFDVSAVTYPANPATIIGARADTIMIEAATPAGFPLSLALAQAAAL